MNLLISILILSSIITVIALYKRSKSLKFRLIKTLYTHDQSVYTPQVRIEGKWFNVWENELRQAVISPELLDDFLEPEDAIKQIIKFKSYSSFTIPSNRKLNSNEKEITVE